MESVETGDEIKWCSLSSRTIFVFTSESLTYKMKNVQHFWNEPVHKFYGLKASKLSRVHATGSSHKYPHVEKNQESS